MNVTSASATSWMLFFPEAGHFGRQRERLDVAEDRGGHFAGERRTIV